MICPGGLDSLLGQPIRKTLETTRIFSTRPVFEITATENYGPFNFILVEHLSCKPVLASSEGALLRQRLFLYRFFHRCRALQAFQKRPFRLSISPNLIEVKEVLYHGCCRGRSGCGKSKETIVRSQKLHHGSCGRGLR